MDAIFCSLTCVQNLGSFGACDGGQNGGLKWQKYKEIYGTNDYNKKTPTTTGFWPWQESCLVPVI